MEFLLKLIAKFIDKKKRLTQFESASSEKIVVNYNLSELNIYCIHSFSSFFEVKSNFVVLFNFID